MSPNPTDPPQPFGGDKPPVFTKIVITDPNVTQWQSEEKASKTIHAYWDTLGGAPGEAIGVVERVRGGYRTRFTNGVIYLTTKTSVCAWIYGAINDYYEKEGGADGWLGLPTIDEHPWWDDGRFVTFANGTVYWWPDTGAIALNNISVRYVGLICFGETDWDQSSDSDEPYAFITVAGGQTTKTKIYGEAESVGGDGGDGVDGGEVRQDFVPIYQGKPSGLGIYVTMMEHDFGKPDQYLPLVKSAMDDASTVIEHIPFFGPVLSIVKGVVGEEFVEAIADVLDLKDDFIAADVVALTPKETVVLAVRPTYRTERGLKFTHETRLLEGHGASYKLYFEITRA